jgi:hypothetical protein
MCIIKSMPQVSFNKSQPKYTKNVKVGEMVHSKCIHVSVEAQCKHWYGRLWKEKYVLGVLQNIKKIQSMVKTNTSTRLKTLYQTGPQSWCLSVTSIVVQGSGLT